MSLRYSSKVPQCASWALQIHYSSKLCQGSWATLCEKVWWSMWTCPHRSSSDKSKNNLSVARIKGSIWWWQLLMTADLDSCFFSSKFYRHGIFAGLYFQHFFNKKEGLFSWPKEMTRSYSVIFFRSILLATQKAFATPVAQRSSTNLLKSTWKSCNIRKP